MLGKKAESEKRKAQAKKLSPAYFQAFRLSRLFAETAFYLSPQKR